MTDLTAIVRATHSSANALKEMRYLAHVIRNAKLQGYDVAIMRDKYRKAERRYERAQEILAANPLPGDETLSNLS